MPPTQFAIVWGAFFGDAQGNERAAMVADFVCQEFNALQAQLYRLLCFCVFRESSQCVGKCDQIRLPPIGGGKGSPKANVIPCARLAQQEGSNRLACDLPCSADHERCQVEESFFALLQNLFVVERQFPIVVEGTR